MVNYQLFKPQTKLELIILFIPILLVQKLQCDAQVKKTPLLEKIIRSDHKSTLNPSIERGKVIDFKTDSPFNGNGHLILKTKKNTYIQINGTGRVYKLNISQDSIYLDREDKTTHFGYNIASYPFTYRDTLYNLGGYGIWRINGQLRKYNPKDREWDIVHLNKEIGLMYGKREGLIFFNKESGKLYACYYDKKNEAVGDHHEFIQEVWYLSVSEKKWHKLGELSDFLKSNFLNTFSLCESPWGLLISSSEKILLLDFNNNNILKLSENTIYYQSILRNSYNTLFFVDSTLYFGQLNNESIDSVVISKNDFIKTENRIYSNWEYKLRDHFFALIFILLIAICIGLYLSFYWKKIRQLKISETEGANINEKTVFTENEISLLKILLHNSLEKVETSIYDVDSVLGLQKKPINLQKKHRSDVLRSLNLKLALTLRSSKEVIIRIRNKEDKRSFNYKIDETFTTQVLDLLERNDSN
ncbi:MAG TPA: hypothetical protein DIW54_02540 [Chitinophagaceae bacterium]|nr:hypothetical protein [Chitinophagaceae bacterium]